MATLFTDTFDRADNNDVGSNWDNTDDASFDWDIASNKLRLTSGQPAYKATTSSAHGSTADVRVSVTQASAVGDGGPTARGPSTSAGGTAALTVYVVKVSAPGHIDILRHNSSDTGTLLQTTSVTQVANGVIGLQVSGVGATVTVEALYQGVRIGSPYLDTSGSRITTAGRTGMYAYDNEGTGAGIGDYDNFIVEDAILDSQTRSGIAAYYRTGRRVLPL